MLELLYEDRDILVPVKPPGMDSQAKHSFEPDMVSELKKHMADLSTTRSPSGSQPYVGVIHRLDKPVGGIMVYAKNQKAAAALSAQLAEGTLKKTYLAVICGKPVDNVGKYVDYLRKDGRQNYSQIVDKSVDGCKKAELSYRVLASRIVDNQLASLVEICLHTGRHHQIRVQFAGRGMPLWGDGKYGERIPGRRLALWSWKLSFLHPASKKAMDFIADPRDGILKQFLEG